MTFGAFALGFGKEMQHNYAIVILPQVDAQVSIKVASCKDILVNHPKSKPWNWKHGLMQTLTHLN